MHFYYFLWKRSIDPLHWAAGCCIFSERSLSSPFNGVWLICASSSLGYWFQQMRKYILLLHLDIFPGGGEKVATRINWFLFWCRIQLCAFPCGEDQYQVARSYIGNGSLHASPLRLLGHQLGPASSLQWCSGWWLGFHWDGGFRAPLWPWGFIAGQEQGRQRASAVAWIMGIGAKSELPISFV